MLDFPRLLAKGLLIFPQTQMPIVTAIAKQFGKHVISIVLFPTLPPPKDYLGNTEELGI
jgi:hypothetical protein